MIEAQMLDQLLKEWFKAFLEGVDIELSKVVPRNYIGTDAYIAKFPLSKGKIPGLEGPGIKIHEVIAISTVRPSATIARCVD